MSQRFEDNIIRAITTSDIALLKNTLENSEQVIHWNQTVDGLSVLALCVKFFHPEIVKLLYPSSKHTLPDDIFTYIIEHAPKIVVDAFASNIIQTINYRLNHDNLCDDDSDAEQVLKIFRKSTPHLNVLVNHSSCNLIGDLLNSKTASQYASLLLAKSIEWDNPKLLNHAIEQIEQNDPQKWCHLSYHDWTADHVQHIFCTYSAQSYPQLNKFLNKISQHTWSNLKKAQHTVMLYSTDVLKDQLNDACTGETKHFIQNAPQYVLQRLSNGDVLKKLTMQELKTLYNFGAGCTIEKYEFLSKTPIRFEIPLILEQHRRVYFSKKETHPNTTEDKERQNFQALCKPLLSSAPYAFIEKRMDLELYYKSIHNTHPNQGVSVLDCLKEQDRVWAEKCLLHEHITAAPTLIKKSKI